MIHTIVTHPGGAHKDDTLAVCLLVGLYGAPVFRREPTREDLDDPGVAVVDVGGRHEPERGNFDHHHLPPDHPPTCALSLVLQHLGLYEDARRFWGWLEALEWFDARGPGRTAAWLGAPRQALSRLESPIDAVLLRRFGAATSVVPGDLLHELLTLVGQDLLADLRSARRRFEEVAGRVVRWAVPVGDDVVEALFLERAAPLPADAGRILQDVVRAWGLEERIAALVAPDRRGPGYGLTRYEDHPCLDFRRVAGEPDVHFAHTHGFVCKTSARDPERLKALLAAAWRRG